MKAEVFTLARRLSHKNEPDLLREYKALAS